MKLLFYDVYIPKTTLACWTNDDEAAPEDDLHQLLEDVEDSSLRTTGIFSWKLCQYTAPIADVHSKLSPCSTCSGRTLKFRSYWWSALIWLMMIGRIHRK